MFPIQYCGTWLLIASTNPMYIGSELSVDYNSIRFSPLQKIGLIKLKKNIYGSAIVQKNKVKIVWLPQVQYDIDFRILPKLSVPYYMPCKRVYLKHDLDKTHTWMTITDKQNKYVFRRINPELRTDSILNIFLTQLLFDFIIRHIYK
jgi:hypothetical protein